MCSNFSKTSCISIISSMSLCRKHVKVISSFNPTAHNHFISILCNRFFVSLSHKIMQLSHKPIASFTNCNTVSYNISKYFTDQFIHSFHIISWEPTTKVFTCTFINHTAISLLDDQTFKNLNLLLGHKRYYTHSNQLSYLVGHHALNNIVHLQNISHSHQPY